MHLALVQISCRPNPLDGAANKKIEREIVLDFLKLRKEITCKVKNIEKWLGKGCEITVNIVAVQWLHNGYEYGFWTKSLDKLLVWGTI